MTIASDLERGMLDSINAARGAEGLAPLQLELNLNESAEGHSEWMLAEDTFSHAGEGGSTSTERMVDAGFDLSGSWGTAENIAYQSERGADGFDDDVADLHEALMNSPGHRANLLNAAYDYVGIGIEIGEFDGHEVIMVTQNFAYTEGEVELDTGGETAPPEPESQSPELADTTQEEDPAPATPEEDEFAFAGFDNEVERAPFWTGRRAFRDGEGEAAEPPFPAETDGTLEMAALPVDSGAESDGSGEWAFFELLVDAEWWLWG